MTSLFSPEGCERFDAMVKPGVLCAFDFDGTLSPLVPSPDDAYLLSGLQPLLIELSRYAPVAIITGRSLEDIRARVGFNPDFIVGNHGLEGLPGWEQRAERYQLLSRGWRDQLASALRRGEMANTHTQIEDKRYSVSLHYRPDGSGEALETRLLNVLEELSPLPRIVAGKNVFNLLPDAAVHKGSALEQLIQSTTAGSAIYVGDDVTDEDVFKLRRSDVLSIRVGHDSTSAAALFLEQQQDIRQLLLALIARLHAQQARNWIDRPLGRQT